MKEFLINAKITSIYPERGTAKVYREDKDIVSAELIILKRGDAWFPKVGDYVACLFYQKGSDGIILGEA